MLAGQPRKRGIAILMTCLRMSGLPAIWTLSNCTWLSGNRHRRSLKCVGNDATLLALKNTFHQRLDPACFTRRSTLLQPRRCTAC